MAGAALADNSSAPPLSWPAVDGLGRRIEDAPPPRPEKFVGVFYYIWHGSHGYDTAFNPSPESGEGPAPKDDTAYRSPYVIEDILAQPASAREWGPVHAFHHWGESRWGFYLADDEWVIRRNAQLLADAGVDVIFFDVTNGFTYRDTYLKICRIYEAMRAEGNRTPQVAFVAWNGDAAAPRVYEDFYKKGLHSELWFRWKGKPLILCKRSQVNEEMAQFFTVRESWAWTNSDGWFGDGKDKWPWLADTPQGYGWHDAPDKPEQVAVATAQHPITNKGKSFHDGRQPATEDRRTEQGLYFAEQWKHALDVDPEFIFITQWNEWIAQRFVAEGPMQLAGQAIGKGDTYFVDLYTMEYNRDIEPMRGGYGDNYYYQMVDGIRRFKGTAAPALPGSFTDDRGDIFHRNHPGYGSAGPYINNSGRNDIISAEVRVSGEIVRISARAATPLTPSQDPNWMMLFLRLSGSDGSHWESFHYVVNRTAPREGKAVLEQTTGGWNWREQALLDMKIDSDTVMVELPRSLFAKSALEPVAFDFKWVDNMQAPGDATDWMVSGDAAPNSRFAYRYRETAPPQQ
jgi:hypothetical protein